MERMIAVARFKLLVELTLSLLSLPVAKLTKQSGKIRKMSKRVLTFSSPRRRGFSLALGA